MVVVMSLAFAAPALAQDAPDTTEVTVLDDGEGAQPESGIVRDDDTSATVRRIRRDLIVIAGVMTVGLGVYVWHTSPSRRLRAAAQRAETVLDSHDQD